MSSSFQKLLKSFVNGLEKQGRARSTILAYGKDIEQLLESLSRQGISSIKAAERAQIKKFIEGLYKKNYTNKSVSRKINSIKTFFKHLMKLGEIKKSPAEEISHPKIKQKPPRVLSPLEYRALRDAARDNERAFAMVELLLQTGLRIGELSRIRLSDIKNEGLEVRGATDEVERKIPLNEAARIGLQSYLKRREKTKNLHLFVTKTGRAILVRNIRSMLNRYFKIAGIEEATVNDIRNTFIAEHLKAGTPVNRIAAWVGHKRVSTTERYWEFVERQEKNRASSEMLEL